jgi:hypothetical protein
MSRECSKHGKKRNACRVLVGKLEEKRQQEDLNVDVRIM